MMIYFKKQDLRVVHYCSSKNFQDDSFRKQVKLEVERKDKIVVHDGKKYSYLKSIY